MSEERHAVKVMIFGSEYTIRGEAREEYIQKLAHYVDEKMKEVAEGTSLTSAMKISILAAINLADEVFRLREQGVDTKNDPAGSHQEPSAYRIAPEAISALTAHIEAALASSSEE